MIVTKLLRTLSSQSKICLLISPMAHAEMQGFFGTSLSWAASFLGFFPLMGRVTALNPQQRSCWLVNSPLLSGNLTLESLRAV